MVKGLEMTFLSKLDEQALSKVVGAAQTRRANAGQTLLTAGQRPKHLVMLTSGRASYHKVTKSGDEIVLHILTRGDVVGLACLLAKPHLSTVGANALSDCDLVSWNHRTIRDLAETYPVIVENSLEIVLRYLECYVDRHSRLVSGVAEERLALTLLDLAERTGRVRFDGIEIETTNDQLGSLSDLSRFTTSRLLSRWRRAGTISKERGKVIVHDPESLAVD